MSEDNYPKEVESIDPAAMAAFEAEMAKRNVDLSQYDLELLATDDMFIILTSYKKKPPSMRGSMQGFPDFEVEILRRDNCVHSVSIAR